MSQLFDLVAAALCARDQGPQHGVDAVLWSARTDHEALACAVGQVANLLGRGAVMLEVTGGRTPASTSPPRLRTSLPVVEVGADQLCALPSLLSPGAVLIIDADRCQWEQEGSWGALQRLLISERENSLAAHPTVILVDRARLTPGLEERVVHLEAPAGTRGLTGAPLLSVDVERARAIQIPVGAIGLDRTSRIAVERDHALRDAQRVVMEWLTTDEAHSHRPSFTILAGFTRAGRMQCRMAATLAASAAMLGVDDTDLLRGTVGTAAHQLQRFRATYLARSKTPPAQRELFA